METKVSVIVPIYNVRKHLKQCLDSLIFQTLQEIEIICVDDASTDGSRELVLQYSHEDSRIVPLFHKTNMGTSQTRKDAVLMSSGQYIMFVDGDDFLNPDSCERAYRAIVENGTDMLQFGVNIINCANVPAERIAMNQRIVKPCIQHIKNADLLRLCWEDEKFRFSLWNKIYNGEICRKAFLQIENGLFPKAQDLYAFFVIAFHSKSTTGIEKKLYNYNFGIGVTGGNYIDDRQFDRLLTERYVYDALRRFLETHDKQGTHNNILKLIYDSFLTECVNKWKENLRPEFRSEGFSKLIKIWGFKDVLCKLAEKNWNNRDTVTLAEKMVDIEYFSHKQGKERSAIETVAIYYRNIKNGGAQRVVANLCNIWAGMKNSEGDSLYHVILITDERILEDEYYLDGNVTREFLPAYEIYTREKYAERFQSWARILSTYSIDVVVTGMWVAPCTFWDMLCVKGHHSHPAFVIHAHNFCALPYQYERDRATEQIYLYQICDGVVTLSECDRSYVSAFCSHVKYIINPATFCTAAALKEEEELSVLWVGRVSKEKQPMDALAMMEYVVSEVPDAKLYMVGEGDENLFAEMQEFIAERDLQNNVILTGFQTDVEPYYNKASVFIVTSEYEGFSLTIGEALSYALPIVSYEMPWLSFMRDGRGIIPVKQHRIDLLAQEVLSLVKDPKKRQELGNAGQQQIIEMEQVDIGLEWKSFFDSILNEDIRSLGNFDTDAILYKYLTIYQQNGRDKILASKVSWRKKAQELTRKVQSLNKTVELLNKKIESLNKQLQKTEKENKTLKRSLAKSQNNLKKIRNSITWRLSKKILAPWRKFKNFLLAVKKK